MSIFNTYMETSKFLIRNIKEIDKEFIINHINSEIMTERIEDIQSTKSFHQFLSWSNPGGELALHNKWIIINKSNEIPIGTIGFNHISREEKCATLECEIGKGFWERKYINEIFDKVLLFAFKKLMLNRIDIQFTKLNINLYKNLKTYGFILIEEDESILENLLADHYHMRYEIDDYNRYLTDKNSREKQYFSKATIIFPTMDMDKTSSFYVENLGFTALNYYSDDSRHIHLQKDQIEIALIDSKDTPVKPYRVLYKQEMMYDAVIYVSDIDTLYKELVQKEIKIVAEQQITHFSYKEFAIEDCDGRYIGIGMMM